MKHRFLTACAAFALAFAPGAGLAQRDAPAQQPAPAAAAPLPDADPAIWVVRDDDTTIYLFGTFHLLDGRPWFNDEVKTAFDASNELVMEAIIPDDLASLQPMIMRYAVDPQGRRLPDRLNAEQYAALGRALTRAGLPANAFDMFEPWFVSMTLATLAAQQLNVNAANGPETVLSRTAHERDMPIGELEGLEWQLRLFDAMPEDQQLTQLGETLGEIDGLAAMMAPMLDAWSRGDVEGLQRIIDAQGEEDPALHRLLFTDRNATWVTWIRDRMARPGTVFLAVGAGHLAGGDSVLAGLAAQGLHAERVPHVEAP